MHVYGIFSNAVATSLRYKNTQNYDASTGPLEAAQSAKRLFSSYKSKKMQRKCPIKAKWFIIFAANSAFQ